jgi:hypothetical protein
MSLDQFAIDAEILYFCEIDFVTRGMRKLPLIAVEELQEIIMRRYERGTSEPAHSSRPNRPVDDWGKLLWLRQQCRRYRPSGPVAAPRTHAQLRAAQLANQDRKQRRYPMTKAKAIRTLHAQSERGSYTSFRRGVILIEV